MENRNEGKTTVTLVEVNQKCGDLVNRIDSIHNVLVGIEDTLVGSCEGKVNDVPTGEGIPPSGLCDQLNSQIDKALAITRECFLCGDRIWKCLGRNEGRDDGR